MNYYDILGIRKTASPEEIKKAYKDLVKKYHPDIYPGDKTFAEKKTAQINIAYETLSNPELKKEYDETTFPRSNYTYTPPQYTSTYDEYKHKYTSYSSTTTHDGSEHDYSTYVNYGNHHTNYHRSTRPNSNYTYTKGNFEDKIFENVDKLNNKQKKSLVILFIIIYLMILIFCIFQLYTILNEFSSKIPDLQNTNIFENNLQITPDASESTIIPEIEIPENVENPESESNMNIITPELPLPSDFNLYDYFSQEELQQLYTEFKSEVNPYITFEEFEQFVKDYIGIFLQTY